MDADGAIIELLRTRGPLARTDLARASGLSSATVGRAVGRLRQAGYVREFPAAARGPGRPARLVELRPDAAFVVGIDAGGSMLRAVRADLEGRIRDRAARPARDPGNGEALVDDLAGLVADVSTPAAAGRVLAVVAGISGIVDHARGRVLVSPDLPGFAGQPVGGLLRARLGLPVAIDNDDLLAAIGEATAGAARGCRDVAFLSLGYGLGAGLIVDGRPLRGASSAAGAIAYLGGSRTEARASGRAIPLRYAEAASGRDVRAGDGHSAARLDARGVFELAANGDPIARAVVAEAVEALADLVLGVAALLDPEIVVLGGGLVANGAVVVEPIAARLRTVLPYPPRLVPSALESAAVVHGAVSLALALARSGVAGRRRVGGGDRAHEAARVDVLELL